MKRILLLAVLLLSALTASAQSGKSLYQKYSDAENVSAVYISPSMFKLIGKLPEIEIGDYGEKVDITGISRGKGYAGVIKRWNAHRLKESHGTGPVARHAGAMSANSSPSKIFPGKIGAGQMGVEQVTVQNLEIVKVDPNLNLIAVKGAVPGANKGIVAIRSTVKKNKIKHAVSSRISTNPQKRSARNA